MQILISCLLSLFCGFVGVLVGTWYQMFPNRTKRFVVNRIILPYYNWRYRTANRAFNKLCRDARWMTYNPSKEIVTLFKEIVEYQEKYESFRCLHIRPNED